MTRPCPDTLDATVPRSRRQRRTIAAVPAVPFTAVVAVMAAYIALARGDAASKDDSIPSSQAAATSPAVAEGRGPGGGEAATKGAVPEAPNGGSSAAPAAGTSSGRNTQSASETTGPPRSASIRDERPVELRPYRVLVRLGLPRTAAWNEDLRAAVVRRFATVTANTLGQMWSLTVRRDDRLLPCNRIGLERLDARTFAADAESGFDKVYCVTVEPNGGRFTVWSREWDATVQRLGPICSARTYDRRSIGDAVFAAVWSAFEPVVYLKLVDADVIHVRIRGGEYLPAVSEFAPLRPGRILQPVFRHYNRDRTLRAIQPIPWTYLIVDSVQRGRARCHAVSGLRINLGARRRRVETVAIGVRPHLAETEVRLALRNAPTKALVAYRVSVYNRKPDLHKRRGTQNASSERSDAAEDSPGGAKPAADGVESGGRTGGETASTSGRSEDAPKPLILMSDRRGIIRVPADPAKPLVWLFISGGKYLLAMVPFVPGTVERTDLLLPDDSVRLGVVAQLELLKAEFVETIARRAVLMSRIRRHTRKGESAKAAELLAELEKLPDNKHYHDELEAIQFAAVQQAKQRRNRLAESRVKVLCKTVRELVDKFLPADGLQKFKDQLKELEEEARVEAEEVRSPDTMQ
ncbi:MAG: hypothetical protein D6725_06015 [Planctomycetota bacterium]|nr:MAG: hypothetical protein D6725_06015 [Planctomycetota bacterium]